MISSQTREHLLELAAVLDGLTYLLDELRPDMETMEKLRHYVLFFLSLDFSSPVW